MKKIFVFNFLICMCFLNGCEDKKMETKVEDGIKDISTTVNKSLKTLDTAAEKNSKK